MTSTYKLSFNVHKLDTEHANILLEEMLGATAISISELKEHADHWNAEAYFPDKPDSQQALSILEALSNTQNIAETLSIEALPDIDWVSKVQSNLSPVRTGNVVIHGSHDRDKFRSHPLAIEIDAGQAFGTAHHGTTKGCLLALQRILKKKQFSNILDLGTGSGILAIALAKLQHTSVITATDIDLISTQVAMENCKSNGVKNLVKILHANGLQHSALKSLIPFDLIVANILAGPLIKIAPQLSQAITPGGHIVLSGLLQTQAQSVITTYRNNNFHLEWRFPLDEWMTLIMKRS